MARAGILDSFVAEEEEAFVLAVVDFRNNYRTADGSAPPVEQEVRTWSACFIKEEVIGPKAGALERIVDAAV